MSTISQAVLNLFTLALGRTQASQLCAEVYELAVELATLKQQMDVAEGEENSKLQILVPHKQRLVDVRMGSFPIIDFYEQIDNEEAATNVDLLKGRDQECQDAIHEIDEQIAVMARNKQNRARHFDDIVSRIARAVNVPAIDQPQKEEKQVLTETMIAPEMLDGAEEQIAQFEAMVEAQQAEQEQPWNAEGADVISCTSEQLEGLERQDYMRQYADLKIRKRELEEAPNASEMQQQIDELHQQILLTCDELAIRRIPCRNGSIIQDEDDGNSSVGYVPRDGQWQLHSNVSMQEADEADNITQQEYSGPGSFDNAPPHIERPRSESLLRMRDGCQLQSCNRSSAILAIALDSGGKTWITQKTKLGQKPLLQI